MRRGLTVSALAAVGFLVGGTAGQPPAAPPKAPADPTDALIQKALANDPDVQVARAKLALAEAEVAKARQAAVSRVITLRDTVEQQQQVVARQTEMLTLRERMAKANQLSRAELLQAQEQVAAARATLARAETELRLLTGDGPKAGAAPRADVGSIAEEVASLLASSDPQAVARALASLNGKNDIKSLAGPIPARLGKALEKKVSLGEKGQRVTFAEALDVFKAKAGFDVPVRPMPQPLPEIISDGVELPVIAWLQMFQDLGGRQGDGFAFYVREYGLLVANRQTAPPDAVSLTAFWRAHSEAEAAPPAPKEPDEHTEWREFPHDKLPGVLKAKAGEAVAIPLPVKLTDVEDAKVGSDNQAIVTRIQGNEKSGSMKVVIYSNRPGKARVDWDVTDATGRRFTKTGQEVEFE
jgi:hypothetical protein